MIRRATLAAALALVAAVGLVSAHTGSISATQTCEAGYSITIHLNADVSASSTWIADLNGHQLGTGPGPGPADRTFTGPVSTGTAHLTIVNGGETHTYSAKLPDVGDCIPTPTPTPTNTPTPTPTPTQPTATPTHPVVTPPSSDTVGSGTGGQNGSGLTVLAVLAGLAVAFSVRLVVRRVR